MACLCLHSPWGLRSPQPGLLQAVEIATWLTKLDHHSAALTLTGPAPRPSGERYLKRIRRMQGSIGSAKPQERTRVHSWYPGGLTSCLLPSHSLHATHEACRHQSHGERQNQKENDEEKGKERKDLEGKEQPWGEARRPQRRRAGGPV